MSLLHHVARQEPVVEPFRFQGVFSCPSARADTRCSSRPTPCCVRTARSARSLAELPPVSEHRRGHGGFYAVLVCGRTDTGWLRRALTAAPLPRAAGGRLATAADITGRLRPDAPTSLQWILCHTHGRGQDQHTPVPGRPYPAIRALKADRS